jgi:hypothetical protein
MDQIAEHKARIEKLERQVEKLTRLVDPALRKLGFPAALDEQDLHINSRGQWSRGDAA